MITRSACALLLILLPAAAVAAENDLSVAWISRAPKIDYVWKSTRPDVEGWPAPGDAVTWIANVRWLGSNAQKNVAYRWTIDGQTVKSGTIDIPAEGIAETELRWTWTFTRHQIVFEIDPANAIAETEERNNRVLIHSNAIAVGFWVERTFWESIRPIVKRANIGATTFDDWMQRLVRRFNEMAAAAIYPDTPNGVIDRWRIDEIHFVEDGALPLAPPYSEARDWAGDGSGSGDTYPNVLDHTIDMQWGFTAAGVSNWNTADSWTLTGGNSIVHELSHARTMIDVYASNVTEEGDFVRLDPGPHAASGGMLYSTPLLGLMHFRWGVIDPYTASAMNRMAGTRAIEGNYNEPWNIGWFMNDFPARNRVRFIRPDGTPIANRMVQIYRSSGETIDWQKTSAYAMVFDNTADFEGQTDANGVVAVDRNPFSDDKVFSFVERQNTVAIVKIIDGDVTRWAYLDSLLFNMAYWRGETIEANYQIMTDAPLCFDSSGGPAKPAPEAAVSTPNVTFQFPVAAGHDNELFVMVDGRAPTVITTTKGTITLALPPGRIVWWTVDRTTAGNCLPKYSPVYGFDHLAGAPIQRRRAVR